MTRMTLSTRVGADGVLHVPLGANEANREVRVTIEPAGPSPMSQEEWSLLAGGQAGFGHAGLGLGYEPPRLVGTGMQLAEVSCLLLGAITPARKNRTPTRRVSEGLPSLTPRVGEELSGRRNMQVIGWK